MTKRASGGWLPGERFDLFLNRANELLATRLVRTEGLSLSWQIEFSRQEGVRSTARALDADDFRSFLMVLRPFISDGEPVYVRWVHNALAENLRGDPLVTRLGEARARWHRQAEAGPFAVILNGERLGPEKLLDLYVNGRYFHNDNRKAKTIEALDPLGRMFTEQVVQNFLIETVSYIVELGKLIRLARSQELIAA